MASEKRLIDANALSDSKWWESLTDDFDKARARIIVMSAPTVDAVEVVRCKDCESHSSNGCPDHRVWCRRLCRFMDSDGFCSDGERREGE